MPYPFRPRPKRLPLHSGALAVGVGLHVLIIIGLGVHTVRQVENGGAPIINLSIAPVASFDSESPPNTARSRAEAGGASGQSEPMPAPLKLRPVPAPDTTETLPIAAAEVRPEVRAPSPNPDPLATQRGAPGPRGAVPSDGEDGRTSAAGATQGGGARAIGAAAARDEDVYAAQVLAWIERHKRHPGRERGVVTVSFQLDRQGRVHRLRLVRSSGSRALDRATLDQITATQPFPRPPADVEWRLYPFTVNVDYRNAR